jgi:hypothetical protein
MLLQPKSIFEKRLNHKLYLAGGERASAAIQLRLNVESVCIHPSRSTDDLAAERRGISAITV